MNVGLFGGSFNPIHRGHIALAKQILKKTRLDEVWFLVSPQNPFKQHDADLLDDDLRYAFTCKALEAEPQLLASDYEFSLPRPSYTWDTLQALSLDYPEHEFTLIIGADNWTAFDRWYHADDILKNYRIAVYPREGHDIAPTSLPSTVKIVNTRLYRISSTDIRQRIRDGRPVRRLLPIAICDEVIKAYQSYEVTK